MFMYQLTYLQPLVVNLSSAYFGDDDTAPLAALPAESERASHAQQLAEQQQQIERA